MYKDKFFVCFFSIILSGTTDNFDKLFDQSLIYVKTLIYNNIYYDL